MHAQLICDPLCIYGDMFFVNVFLFRSFCAGTVFWKQTSNRSVFQGRWVKIESLELLEQKHLLNIVLFSNLVKGTWFACLGRNMILCHVTSFVYCVQTQTHQRKTSRMSDKETRQQKPSQCTWGSVTCHWSGGRKSVGGSGPWSLLGCWGASLIFQSSCQALWAYAPKACAFFLLGANENTRLKVFHTKAMSHSTGSDCVGPCNR